MTCACGLPFIAHSGTGMTLVGYASPPGHNHDDNCRTRAYLCPDGHRTHLSARNHCTAPGCEWVGKAECRTCQHTKLEHWPETVEYADWLAAQQAPPLSLPPLPVNTTVPQPALDLWAPEATPTGGA